MESNSLSLWAAWRCRHRPFRGIPTLYFDYQGFDLLGFFEPLPGAQLGRAALLLSPALLREV